MSLQYAAICIVGAIIAWCLVTAYNASREQRGFQASQKRAEDIIKSGAGGATSYGSYQKIIGGADAVEFSAVRDLARVGNLTVPTLSERLSKHNQYYVG